MAYRFPEKFLWGSATSSYQVEGGNIYNDWWDWEKKAGLPETSGSACRHYELYKQDFDLAKSLNHNAHRFSIEWSRIEPQENEFSAQEIQHYRDVALALRERGIEPIITLHHFTNPLWFSRRGGWENPACVKYFLRYTEKIVCSLAEHVKFWITINEPIVYAYHSYIMGFWPPQKKSFWASRRVVNHFIQAHNSAYRLIHRIYKQKKLPLNPMVSFAHNMQAFVGCNPEFKNRLSVFLRDKCFNFNFIERLYRSNSLDFIGINYYTRSLVDLENYRFNEVMFGVCRKGHNDLKKNSLGWEIYPQGLYDFLIRLKRFGRGIFILENGICTEDDSLRWEFIQQHLKSVHAAIHNGAHIMGYLYWSLLDNYEWDKGFKPRFGLVEVDYATQRRSIRESAKNFSRVCKNGVME